MTVELEVPRLGESSIPMDVVVRVGDTGAATAETVQVAYDRDDGES